MLFMSIYSYSAGLTDNYILMNTGIKISIKPNSFRVDSSEKTVFYKELNSDKENSLRFKDFDFILFGKHKFQTFKVNNSSEVNGYFVLAQSSSKTLIFSTKSDEIDSNSVFYFLYILDSDNNVIESIKFDNHKSSKSSTFRSGIYPLIRYHFLNCNLLIDRISSFDNTSFENLNLDILGFFDTPFFISCSN
jgi:hypothetical protein